MAVVPKAGARLRSVTCETEVVVVRSGGDEIDRRHPINAKGRVEDAIGCQTGDDHVIVAIFCDMTCRINAV